MVHAYPKKGFLTSPSNSLRVPYQSSAAQWWFCLFCWEHHLYLNTFLPHCNPLWKDMYLVFVYLNNMADKNKKQTKKNLYNEDTSWHATVVSTYLQVKSYGQSMTVEGEERISFCQRQPLTCYPIQNGHLWTYEQCKVDFLW